MRKENVGIANGQGGVYRTVYELIARGHKPYLPVVDDGIDILLRSGIRIQVKTTQRTSQHWRFEGCWSFTLTKAQRIVKRKFVKCEARTFSDEVDFVVLHAAQANRFWIVPAAVLDGRNTVCFKDGVSQWKTFDFEAAKRMRAEGASYQTIADALGATHHTVMRRLKGSFVVPKRKYADIAQYENRWDLIGGAVSMLAEANAVVQKEVVFDS